MCPQRTTPAPNRPRQQYTRQRAPTQPRRTPHLPRQCTLWDFIGLPRTPSNTTTPTTPPTPTTHDPTHDSPPNSNSNTPTTTPVAVDDTPPTQPFIHTEAPNSSESHQSQLAPNTSNEPWGDMWVFQRPITTFRVVSKNTGTINLQNLDMQAITQELLHINASVFAAQETNVHWDTATNYQLYQQCKRSAPQIKITTATSQEPAADWYKPGGTLLLTLNAWTSRVIKQGSDSVLGRWSYQELLGKNNQRVVIVSGYRVCKQKFDGAANTTSAQQTRLLQAQGEQHPNPRRRFLDDLILQIQEWRQDHKEVIVCLDANEPVDDPRSEIARLFSETDLTDLHQHRYPSLRKPATYQRGSQAIDLIAGSPAVTEALLHAWIHPFGDPVSIKGDHRLLGVDLDPEILFGQATIPVNHPQHRGAKSKHAQTVNKFCKQVVQKCNQQQLAQRIATLQSVDVLQPHHQIELEAIDTSLTKILLTADKACLPQQKAPWSPELNQAYLRHRLWTLTLTAKRTERDMTDVLTALRKHLLPSPLDEQEKHNSLSTNLRNAQKNLRKAKKEADALRKKHLDALLNEARVSNKKKQSKMLTHLINAEQNRRCYASFRQHTKPKSPGGLAYITIQEPGQPVKTIMDCDEMNDTLLDYSRTHFAKAQGSPFTIDPLQRLLQYDGLTTFGNQILKGRADLDNMPLEAPTRALLLQMKDKMPATSTKDHPLLYDELQKGIKKWPENTTTSPSGRHLGIYKSLQRHVLTQEEKDAIPPSQLADPIKEGRDVLFLIFDIMSLALRHTYTLERWKTVWTLFIEKELGNPDLNRLRCIMLFEADWQLLLKWHSSYGFLPKSEKAKTLTEAQGGGRKGRSAIDQATQQIVEAELIKLNQRPAIDLFLDARHCFDLMVEACHNMACRRQGAADDYLRLHAQTHRLMKYYVRHKYGMLEDFNTFENHPWHGAGQGAADAALHYIVLSNALIVAYHTRIQPWIITDPTLTMTIVKSLKAFIDNMAMSVGGKSIPFDNLVQTAQMQLQWWTQLLQASGRELNPKKCCCTIYDWKPDTSGILRFSPPSPNAIAISLYPTQPNQTIQILKPNEGT